LAFFLLTFYLFPIRYTPYAIRYTPSFPRARDAPLQLDPQARFERKSTKPKAPSQPQVLTGQAIEESSNFYISTFTPLHILFEKRPQISLIGTDLDQASRKSIINRKHSITSPALLEEEYSILDA
jgi:hypothetical protein